MSKLIVSRGVVLAVLMLAVACTNVCAEVGDVMTCTCGDVRAISGKRPMDLTSGEGTLRITADTASAPDIRDPRGRWMRFDRARGRYGGDIPGATSGPEISLRIRESRLSLEIPGPVTGDYLFEVPYAGDEWEWVDVRVDGAAGRWASVGVNSQPRASLGRRRWRVHYQLQGEPMLQADTLAVGDSVATLPPWQPLTLPCKVDWDATRPAPDVVISATGRRDLSLTLTPPSGQNVVVQPLHMPSPGPSGVWPGVRSSSIRSEDVPGGVAIHLNGPERFPYQFGVTPTTTDTVTVRLTSMRPDGRTVSFADSFAVRAGETRWWHFECEAAPSVDSAWLRFGRGPRVFPLVEPAKSEIVGIGAEPALSADGRVLAFIRDDGVWRMDLATGRSTCLVRAREPHWPAWSPDGRTLLFQARATSRDWARWSIWSVDSAGREFRRLSPAPDSVDEQYPLWSPRGDEFVFTQGRRLCVTDAGRLRVKAITRAPAAVFERACEWSSVTKPILYVADDGPNGGPQYEVREVRRVGAGQRAATPYARAEDARRIGPDALLGLRSHELFVAAGRGGESGADWFLDDFYLRRFRSRIALTEDHRTAYVGCDPWPNGDPLIMKVALPEAPDPLLVAKYRDAVTWIGCDSVSVQRSWGPARLSGPSRSNGRFWWYDAGSRSGHSVGDVQLEFDFLGRLAGVTRVPSSRRPEGRQH